MSLHGRPADDQTLRDLCAAFQSQVVETLVGRAVRAARQEGVAELVLGGGVAANRQLRERATEVGVRRGAALSFRSERAPDSSDVDDPPSRRDAPILRSVAAWSVKTHCFGATVMITPWGDYQPAPWSHVSRRGRDLGAPSRAWSLRIFLEASRTWKSGSEV